MTKEDKELLLRDLCMRLPYGIKCQYTTTGWNPETDEDTVEILDDEVVFIEPDIYNAYLYEESTDVDIEDIKPYLRPMSSMTEEERNEYFDFRNQELQRVAFAEVGRESAIAEISDWLNSHHFDYRGLIPKGLALEAPEGMYK